MKLLSVKLCVIVMRKMCSLRSHLVGDMNVIRVKASLLCGFFGKVVLALTRQSEPHVTCDMFPMTPSQELLCGL